jgi:hypothetical protein
MHHNKTSIKRPPDGGDNRILRGLACCAAPGWLTKENAREKNAGPRRFIPATTCRRAIAERA